MMMICFASLTFVLGKSIGHGMKLGWQEKEERSLRKVCVFTNNERIVEKSNHFCQPNRKYRYILPKSIEVQVNIPDSVFFTPFGFDSSKSSPQIRNLGYAYMFVLHEFLFVKISFQIGDLNVRDSE
jgi:hypothetical protein